MILGHDREKRIFKRIIENNKVVNGYIFEGKEGIGKKLFAKYLAKSLFCNENSYFEKCRCRECALIDSGNHPDVVFLDESRLKIDDIRFMSELALMTPLRGDYKVFILDNVHYMTREAEGAFLKTLEEPFVDSIFILVTSRYEALIPTIRSRCTRVTFSRLSDNDLRNIISGNCVESEVEKVISLSEGSVKTAKKIIDKEYNTDINSIENRDWISFARMLESVDNKAELYDLIFQIYQFLYSIFVKSYNLNLLFFSDYLLEVLNKLDYNVNLDIVKLDLLGTTIKYLK